MKTLKRKLRQSNKTRRRHSKFTSKAKSKSNNKVKHARSVRRHKHGGMNNSGAKKRKPIFVKIDQRMREKQSRTQGRSDVRMDVDAVSTLVGADEDPSLRSKPHSYGERAAALGPAAGAQGAADGERSARARADRDFVGEDDLKVRTKEILRGPPSEQVVVEHFDIPVTRRLFHALSPYTWLNDEIINYYMSLLQDRCNKLLSHYKAEGVRPEYRRSHFFNNFFVNKLLDNEFGRYHYPYVRRWSKKFDTFEQDKIFCPVNIKDTHWTLAVIYVQDRRICYYDSMGGEGRRYVDGLFQYVKDEHEDKKKRPLPDPESWELVYGSRRSCPQQENGTDCGVFTICNADFLSDNLKLDYTQDDVTRFWRTKIAVSILRTNLNYALL